MYLHRLVIDMALPDLPRGDSSLLPAFVGVVVSVVATAKATKCYTDDKGVPLNA
jgi:hypothetical protein